MHLRVPLRTGRVFYAVAWAVSEGPDRLVFTARGLLFMNDGGWGL